jgi:hypothetical protein
MSKITGFRQLGRGVDTPRRGARSALLLAMALILLPLDPALACRGVMLWSTGADLGKLKPGEIAVKAKLIESYKGEQTFPTIMGLPFGMMYYVEVTKILGSADGTKPEFDTAGKAKIFIRLAPFPCEQYFPENFAPGAEKVLVLTKGATGLYELVGGQE